MGQSASREGSNNIMNKVCLLVIATLAFVQFALGESEVRSNDDYNLMTCVEPEGVNPEDDAEIDKHCSHEKVDSGSLPEADLTGAPSDRVFSGAKCYKYYGNCLAKCTSTNFGGHCILRWYWWITLIKEVRLYVPSTEHHPQLPQPPQLPQLLPQLPPQRPPPPPLRIFFRPLSGIWNGTKLDLNLTTLRIRLDLLF